MVGIRKILFEDISLTARTLLVVEQSLSSSFSILAVIGDQKEFSLIRGSPRFRAEVRFERTKESVRNGNDILL